MDPPKGRWQIVPSWRSAFTDRRFGPHERTELEDFLRPFKPDLAVMSHLRDVLNSTDPVGRFTDDEVVETVAWRLSTKELVLRQSPIRMVPDAGGGGSSDQQAAQPPAETSQASPAVPDEPDPDTFGGDSDQQAQASALGAAAGQGSPFCEQCQNA